MMKNIFDKFIFNRKNGLIDVFGTNVSEIGVPDHSYIVSELQMCG